MTEKNNSSRKYFNFSAKVRLRGKNERKFSNQTVHNIQVFIYFAKYSRQSSYSEKLGKNPKNTPMMEYYVGKIAGLRSAILLKQDPEGCFKNKPKFSEQVSLYNASGRLLLNLHGPKQLF